MPAEYKTESKEITLLGEEKFWYQTVFSTRLNRIFSRYGSKGKPTIDAVSTYMSRDLYASYSSWRKPYCFSKTRQTTSAAEISAKRFANCRYLGTKAVRPELDKSGQLYH